MTIRELYKDFIREALLVSNLTILGIGVKAKPIAVENKNGDYSVPNVDFHDREAWEWEEYDQIVEIFPKMVILEGSDTEVD